MPASHPGPFYDFSPAQWQTVRATHRHFCVTKDLGRPLLAARNLSTLLWHHRRDLYPDEPIALAGPARRDPEMDGAIRFFAQAAGALARSPIATDGFPVLFISRQFYGHSQRLAEPFGTVTKVEGHQHAQAEPSIHDLSAVASLRLKPVAQCPYLSKSLEVLRYFVESTESRYYIPQMVTTGPCDTVNYALGSTQFLESLYTHPREIHQLLRMATEVIIEHILACRAIAGERLLSDHTYLLDGSYCICSEIRSQFSGEHYAEFEAPYLRRIGEAVGPLNLHVSGPIEQSLPGTLADPNIRHLKFWLRDCNLADVVAMTGARVSLDFFRNDCMPALGFPDAAAYYRHILERVRPETRWVVDVYEPEAWNQAWEELDREGRLPEEARRLGRLTPLADTLAAPPAPRAGDSPSA